MVALAELDRVDEKFAGVCMNKLDQQDEGEAPAWTTSPMGK